MSRIFKVCILGPDGSETIAIKPCIKKFENFKEEIFIRLPELKSQTFKIYYHGESYDSFFDFMFLTINCVAVNCNRVAVHSGRCLMNYFHCCC